MIIVKLSGGLGNQMFQYAAAKSLAIKSKTNLSLDLTTIEISETSEVFTRRMYGLDVFKLNAQIIKKNRFNFLHSSKPGFVGKIKRKLSSYQYYFEKRLEYDPDFFYLGQNTYLDGYFQSHKYFESCNDFIIKDFQFANEANETNRMLMNKIGDCESIAIHFRRGDYADNSFVLKTHGLCSITYYEKAINYFQEYCKKPVFYVFSDDPDWVKKNFTLNVNFHVIDHNQGECNYEDLRLMSACKHVIIANSSYSWWGAWLNPNSEKKIIAPKTWFADPDKEAQSGDMIPKEWIRL